MGAGIPLAMYEKDEIDLVGVGGSSLERVQDPNNPLHSDLRLSVNMCTSYVGFNSSQPPFNDPLVRRAFSYGLDRDRLISGLQRGNALPAAGPLPPGMPGYSGDLDGYTYDPERARSLLAQAGYDNPSDLPPLTYTTSGYGSPGAFVTAVITMWEESLGVAVEPVLLDPFTYLDELYAGNLGSFYSSGWCADYPDPENFLDVLYHSGSPQNLGGFSNPAVDALLEQARTEPDVQARMALYGDIEQKIVDEAPAVFLSHSLSAVLVKPHLQNYMLTPMGVPQWHQVELDYLITDP
jgi:ABC-type transport system substrate-binding protein